MSVLPLPRETARATAGTYPSCLSAQLVLRTQARRKEKGPRSTPLLARPYNDGEPRGRPLAPIRLANAAAQLVLRTQARRKEKGPRSTPLLARPYNDREGLR